MKFKLPSHQVFIAMFFVKNHKDIEDMGFGSVYGICSALGKMYDAGLCTRAQRKTIYNACVVLARKKGIIHPDSQGVNFYWWPPYDIDSRVEFLLEIYNRFERVNRMTLLQQLRFLLRFYTERALLIKR